LALRNAEALMFDHDHVLVFSAGKVSADLLTFHPGIDYES
jgi:hypothetical protein